MTREKLPVSSNLDLRLKYEKNKSPIWLLIEVIIPIININTSNSFVRKIVTVKITIHERTIDPIAPEIVLLGLNLVNLTPLNILPNI